MRTVRQICAIVLLTVAFSTFAFSEEGWIGTGHKPPQTQPTPAPTTSQQTADTNIVDTGEESSYFDEMYDAMYEATLLFLRMNLL
jgi:hypothetical protein